MFRSSFVRRWRNGSKKESFSSGSWQRCPRPRGSFWFRRKSAGRVTRVDLYSDGHSAPGRRFQLELLVFHDMQLLSRSTGEALMAKLMIPYLFSWQEVEARSGLERLRLVFNHIGDEGLMRELEAHRKWGRNEYPITPVWNSVLAGIVYQHSSVDSLRRELSRNGELRDQCGFNPQKGSGAVPPSWVYTRFLKLLFKYKGEIDGMFDRLVDELKALLPDLGFSVAGDSKGVDSAGGT